MAFFLSISDEQNRADLQEKSDSDVLKAYFELERILVA